MLARNQRRIRIADLLLAAIILPIVCVMFAIWSASRPYWGLGERSVCASNLNGIAKALATYAQNYRGRFPPDIDTLVSTGLAQPGVFICPNSESADDSFAVIETYSFGQPISPRLHEILHSCYVYLPGQTAPANPANVLMYEKKGCHPDDGGNVLFADGHVQWVEPYWKIEQVVAQTKERLAAGTNPSSKVEAPSQVAD